MNYTNNTEGTDFTIEEQIAGIDKQLKKLYKKTAGNVGLALVSPLLSAVLNSSVSKKIAALNKEKKELQSQLKSA